jgi:hypothetical protein
MNTPTIDETYHLLVLLLVMFFNLQMQVGQQDVLYKLLGCFQCRPMICKKGKIIPISNIAFLFSSLGWWESINGCCLQTQFEEAITIHLLLTLSPM